MRSVHVVWLTSVALLAGCAFGSAEPNGGPVLSAVRVTTAFHWVSGGYGDRGSVGRVSLKDPHVRTQLATIRPGDTPDFMTVDGGDVYWVWAPAPGNDRSYLGRVSITGTNLNRRVRKVGDAPVATGPAN